MPRRCDNNIRTGTSEPAERMQRAASPTRDVIPGKPDETAATICLNAASVASVPSLLVHEGDATSEETDPDPGDCQSSGAGDEPDISYNLNGNFNHYYNNDSIYDPVTSESHSVSSPSSLTVEPTAEGVRNKSPVTVLEWVNSLPTAAAAVNYKDRQECDTSNFHTTRTEIAPGALVMGTEVGRIRSRSSSPVTTPANITITSCREPSEAESHCSSVDSLLESRKPDPEEILLSLGFGGTASSSYLETGRVPKRFLNQSQLKGVDIEEFIKQQQDLIYTFESGFYGYRGLAGPSHSNPSAIVGKILERLRDHEKESSPINSSSCVHDFRKRCSADSNAVENSPNKFSKIAKNVLTKIRCAPSSVLSPDNKKWLDSQGNKSPEVVKRRLILGQQSFTLGRDGDLIETFEDALHQHRNGSIFNVSIPTKITEKTSGAKQEVRSDKAAGSPLQSTTTEANKSEVHFVGDADEDEVVSDRSLGHLNVELVDKYPSLHDEMSLLTDDSFDDDKNQRNAGQRRTKNVLTRYSSFEESVDESSDDADSSSRSESTRQNFSGYGMDKREKMRSITEMDAVWIAKDSPAKKMNISIEQEYEDLQGLKSVIEPYCTKCLLVPKEHFISATIEQQSSLQSKLIKQALEVYLDQLHKDNINSDLKNCLVCEARKVLDLLDGNCDNDKLSIVVRQMTLLFKQQTRLSSQIKDVSYIEKDPNSCHQKVREWMTARVQELELLVKQNAQELALMKDELLQN